MKWFHLIFLILLTFSLQAQKTFTIKGVVEDTLHNSLISSTVLLLQKSDSTMVEFTRTELDGSFIFRKVPQGNYLVKTTYIGYIPLTVDASSIDGKNIDLGSLAMTELASELMEVVIKAAKAPIKMRGDTIEYDASTFQVPEGSSVEELLKRLPGIEIDQDGSISADGKSVDQVTVDGKKFFGSDPKAATKNLPAEGISKVQVFDTKTEEEKITGSTGEAQSKTMNLELKEEFKKGSFGRVTAGIGTESRAELKGNLNRFNEKIQFSVVAVAYCYFDFCLYQALVSCVSLPYSVSDYLTLCLTSHYLTLCPTTFPMSHFLTLCLTTLPCVSLRYPVSHTKNGSDTHRSPFPNRDSK